MARQLTFIDVDENRLELWLKPDRVQLVVIDSRPELEAGELRRFASVVFAEYVARDLASQLGAARGRLQEVRDRAPGGELGAALDGALRAIDELAAAVALPETVAAEVEPDDPGLDLAWFEPVASPAPLDPADPAARPAPAARPEPIVAQSSDGSRRYPSLQATLRASRKRSRRGERAEEGSAIRWNATSGEVAAAG